MIGYSTAFNEMNIANKQQTIRQNLEQLVLDMPEHILFLENIANSLDEKIGWKEFKFCFKLATSQIVSENNYIKLRFRRLPFSFLFIFFRMVSYPIY